MGVDADLFLAWKQRPPAFLVHVEGEATNGSGIQIDPQHVVTCAHVFRRHPQQGQENEENFYESRGPLTEVKDRTAVIRSGHFRTDGVVAAQHHMLDLVLVRLARSRPGVASPFLLDDPYRGDACAIGLHRNAGRLECLQQSIEIETEGASRGTTPTHVKFDYGPREGTSGGGVFAVRDGRLLLVGIAHLGGELSKMGGYIPSVAVVEFLRNALDFKNSLYPSGEYAIRLLSAGIAPALEFKVDEYRLKLSFAAVLPDATGTDRPLSFVARRIISASEMRLETKMRMLPGHRRLAAWADKIEQAEAAIERLGRIFKLKLRLPTPKELEFSWGPQGSGARAPEGRPLTLSDFRSNELGIEVPPAGVYEWARDRSGIACAIEPGSDRAGMQSIHDDQADDLEPCFRAAFDAEGI
jgi:hypothetical protein